MKNVILALLAKKTLFLILLLSIFPILFYQNCGDQYITESESPVINTDVSKTIVSNTNSVTWEGSCSENSLIQIKGAETGTAQCSGGHWQYKTQEVSNDGERIYYAGQSNLAGAENQLVLTWIRDTVDPSLEIIQSDKKSANSTEVFQGRCEPDVLVVAKYDNREEKLFCPTDGNLSVTVSGTENKTYQIEISQTDEAGNRSHVNATWTKDPFAPTMNLSSDEVVIINKDDRATYSGVCERNYDIYIEEYIANSGYTRLATIPCESGSWIQSIDVLEADISLPTKERNFRAMQIFDNQETSLRLKWIRDIEAPILTLNETATIKNSSNYVTFSGLCEPSIPISVTIDNHVSQTPATDKVTCMTNSTWSYSYYNLNEGTYDFSFSSEDQAENHSNNGTPLIGTWIRDAQSPNLTLFKSPSTIINKLTSAQFNLLCQHDVEITFAVDTSQSNYDPINDVRIQPEDCQRSANGTCLCPADGQFTYEMKVGSNTGDDNGTSAVKVSQTNSDNQTASFVLNWQRDTIQPDFTLDTQRDFSDGYDYVTFAGSCEVDLPILISINKTTSQNLTSTVTAQTFCNPAEDGGQWTFTDFSSEQASIVYSFSQTDQASNVKSDQGTWIRNPNIILKLSDSSLQINTNTRDAVFSGSCFVDTAGTNKIKIWKYATDGTLVNPKDADDNPIPYEATCTAGTDGTGTFSYDATMDADETFKYVFEQVDPRGKTVQTTGMWTCDASAPNITKFLITTPDGTDIETCLESGCEINSFYVPFHLEATDNASVITQYCIKSISTGQTLTPPNIQDSCWENVPAPSKSINIKANKLAGFSPLNYTLYAFVHDSKNNITSLTQSGAGTYQLDLNRIFLNPVPPPQITQVTAYQGGNPLYISGSDLIISWIVEDANPPTTGIENMDTEFYISKDDKNYINIASLKTKANNSTDCTPPTVSLPKVSGCVKWSPDTALGLSGNYFRVRVQINNSKTKLYGSGLSNIINFSKFNVLAGNTYNGTGSSMNAAMIVNGIFPEPRLGDSGSFVVDTYNGQILFRDENRGIMRVNPQTGLVESLITIDLNTAWKTEEAAGNAPISLKTNPSLARIRVPIKIALDWRNGLIVWDFDRIRRIDFSDMNDIKIETLYDGGMSYLYNGNLYSLSINNLASFQGYRSTQLLVSPNNDIYFQRTRNDGLHGIEPDLSHTIRLTRLKFNSTTLTYTKQDIEMKEMNNYFGYTNFPAEQLQYCRITTPSITFDKQTGNVKNMFFSIQRTTNDKGVCSSGTESWLWGFAATALIENATPILQSLSAAAQPPYLITNDKNGNYASQAIASRDGELYMINRQYGVLKKYNATNNEWQTIIGKNSGTVGKGAPGFCDDNVDITDTNCKITPVDGFVTTEGQIFLMEPGRLRVLIDSNGTKVLKTLIGSRLDYGGDDVDPLAARFSMITDIGRANDGEIFVHDFISAEIRKFKPGITGVQKIAGVGGERTGATTAATLEPLTSGLPGDFTNKPNEYFALDPQTKDIYMSAIYRSYKLSANDNYASWSVGGQGNLAYNAPSIDGKKMSEINFLKGINHAGNTVSAGRAYILGVYNNQLFATHDLYITTLVNGKRETTPHSNYYRLYDIGNNYAGKTLAGDNEINLKDFCEPGTNVLSCKVAAFEWSFPTPAIYQSSLANDPSNTNCSANGCFMLGLSGSKILYGFPQDQSKSMFRFHNTKQSFYSIDYDKTSDTVYYCATNGNIYKEARSPSVTPSVSTALWNKDTIPIRCEGNRLILVSDGNGKRLIFPYTQNGLHGVAEYKLE